MQSQHRILFVGKYKKHLLSPPRWKKYPGLLPRCSWMTGKRGQSPRYLRPFRSSNNGKFPENALLCPGRGVRGFTLTCALLKINPVSTVEGKITSIIFFSDRERVVFYKSGDLIGSESGQYSPFPARSQRVRFFSQPFVRFQKKILKCYSPAKVGPYWELTVPSVLCTALGLQPRYPRPRAQFFPIRTSRLVNNIYERNSKKSSNS